MQTILKMYITLLPAILAGILNMIFCKAKVLKSFYLPIDQGKNYIDGKRIFGDNKTIKGLFGYIVINAIIYIIFGYIYQIFNINHYNYFYINYYNTFYYNFLIGLLLGFAYALFELPNSFIKRRLDIKPGKTSNGVKKYFFIFLDQADSIIGMTFVILLFYDLSFNTFISFVLLGALTHILFNILLYYLKLRKNIF